MPLLPVLTSPVFLTAQQCLHCLGIWLYSVPFLCYDRLPGAPPPGLASPAVILDPPPPLHLPGSCPSGTCPTSCPSQPVPSPLPFFCNLPPWCALPPRLKHPFRLSKDLVSTLKICEDPHLHAGVNSAGLGGFRREHSVCPSRWSRKFPLLYSFGIHSPVVPSQPGEVDTTVLIL